MDKMFTVLVLCFSIMQLVLATTPTIDEVTLELRGIDCSDKCKNMDCLSSIMINKNEMSLKKVGLNVVVMKVFTGEIIRKRFQYYGEDFINYFKQITDNSVVIIVSQDMCDFGYQDWYRILTNHANITFKSDGWTSDATTAVVVGCKGQCPEVIIGNLPYSYFGKATSHEVTITFVKNGAVPLPMLSSTSSPPSPSTTQLVKETEKNRLPLLIGIATGVLCLAVLVLMLIVCLRRRGYCGLQKGQTSRQNSNNNDSTYNEANVNTEGVSEPPDVCFGNVAYGKQRHIINLNPDPIYAEYAAYKNRGKNSIPSEYQCLKKESVQYDKIDSPLTKKENEYTYILPEEKLSRLTEQSESAPHVGITIDVDNEDSHLLSTSAGTSQLLFRRSMENVGRRSSDSSDQQFATYLTFETNDDAIYKTPSSVPKFEAPTDSPKAATGENYVAMDEGTYEQTYETPENVYHVLSENKENISYTHLQ